MNFVIDRKVSTVSITNWQWILNTSINLVFATINLIILRKEVIKRKRETQNRILPYYVNMCSLLCIICGVFVTIFGGVSFVPGFCYFSRQFGFILSGFQGTFMGFFQLSQLYYCFSSSKYPKHGIIIMYTIGCIIPTILTLCSLLFQRVQYCAIDQHYNYIETNTRIITLHVEMYSFIIWICLYIIWDFLTLLLYIWKLVSSIHLSNNNTIKPILKRMVILTLLYEITIIIVLNGALILIKLESHTGIIFLEGLVSTSMSYVMFLMQQHNTKEYEQFLKCIRFIRIHYICCCCKSLLNVHHVAFQSTSFCDVYPEINQSDQSDQTIGSSTTTTMIILNVKNHNNRILETTDTTTSSIPILDRDVSDFGLSDSDTFHGLCIE